MKKKTDVKPIIEKPAETTPKPFEANDLEMEKKINELSEKVVSNSNQTNSLNDKVSDVVRKIDDLQKDITEIYKDRDTLGIIQNKITENTNSINNVSVANTKSTTELKSEIRALADTEETKLATFENRVKALEEGHTITDGKFEIVKKLWGKLYIIRLK